MIDIEKFVSIAEWLSSSNSGERSVAAAHLSGMLHDADLTWADVLRCGILWARATRRWVHVDAANACLKSGEFSEKEKAFLFNITRFAQITEKQAEWLSRLCQRCNVAWPQVNAEYS